MKFCMVGCGGHASSAHGPAQRFCAKTFSDIELTACCDRDPARAAAYQAEFGFQRHYSDLETMLQKERPDAICVTLPTHIMASVLEPLLSRGIPILLEKPPGLTSEDLDHLIAAADRGKGLHLVGFNRRFMPVMSRTRALLDQILPPETVLEIQYEMFRNARVEPDFSTTAIHAFDAALFLARSRYRKATFSYRELPALGDGVVQVRVNAEFESGTRIHFAILPVAGLTAERIGLHGVGHSVFTTLFDETLSHWRDNKEVLSLNSQSDPSLVGSGFTEETAAFFAALREGKPGHPTLREAEQPVALMEAMRTRCCTIEWPVSVDSAPIK